MAIHYIRNPGGGCKIGAIQLQLDLSGRHDRWRRPLDDGSVRYASQRGMIHGLTRPGAAGDEAASHYKPLRDRVNLTIDTAQAGHQEHTALQARRIAHSGHTDV